MIKGSIELVLVFCCDRCLEDFVCPQKIDFQLVMDAAAQDANLPDPQCGEYEFDAGQIEVLHFDGQSVDLGDLLYQQMILSVPQKNLCQFDCRGICEDCGAFLNLEECACSNKLEEPVFAALQTLLKNNK
ncbi:MAG: DUF177 domain-containing protein [Desulfobulbaceae bacterium]|nr:DUF177 domain-containing protein [Desulfobulbaceae bacterium]